MPAGETTASLDRAFAAANAGRSADIPTAVGFCMYITRHCLHRVGPFDHDRYGEGYGEEVDFCMRAARRGFRNVIAADVFVHHVGEVSFAAAVPGAGRRRRRWSMRSIPSSSACWRPSCPPTPCGAFAAAPTSSGCGACRTSSPARARRRA
jgi:GT2 family glycosyltransferase